MNMLERDAVSGVDDHAVRPCALGKPVVRKHAEKLWVEHVALLPVSRPCHDRHAKQVVGALAVVDGKNRRFV